MTLINHDPHILSVENVLDIFFVSTLVDNHSDTCNEKKKKKEKI
jgi:hypothetical protein